MFTCSSSARGERCVKARMTFFHLQPCSLQMPVARSLPPGVCGLALSRLAAECGRRHDRPAGPGSSFPPGSWLKWEVNQQREGFLWSVGRRGPLCVGAGLRADL